MKTLDFSKNGLGKAFQALIMVLFNYGHSFLIKNAKDWASLCEDSSMDLHTFKFGLVTQVSLALADLTSDLRDEVLCGNFHNCKSIVKSIKLISKLL